MLSATAGIMPVRLLIARASGLEGPWRRISYHATDGTLIFSHKLEALACGKLSISALPTMVNYLRSYYMLEDQKVRLPKYARVKFKVEMPMYYDGASARGLHAT